MSVIVHNRTEHVEKKRRPLRGNTEGADHSYLPPEVFALTWHADVGHIMRKAPQIAYIIHLICHQLSLDLLCVNATCW